MGFWSCSRGFSDFFSAGDLDRVATVPNFLTCYPTSAVRHVAIWLSTQIQIAYR